MMRNFLIFLALVFSATVCSSGQYVRIGDGSYLSNIGGPFTASTGLAKYNSRFAYIYTRTTLGNIRNGDSITSLEFKRSAGVALNTACNVKIYLANTSLYDFGSGNLSWSNAIGSATLVYNQNPADIGTEEGFHTLPLSQTFVYDSAKGENLALFVEYSQTATQPGNVFFYFESSTTVSGLASNQTKYLRDTVLRDSLKSSSDYHPTLIINYPRKNRDIAMIGVYTLGKLPVPLGNPDSVKVLIRNVGKKDASGVSIYTWLQGFNSGIDSTKIDIKKGTQGFYNIPSLYPTKNGLDTVYAAIIGDQYQANDTGTSFRWCNANVYSYRDVTKAPAPGGIGFGGSTGDFVARFFSNKSKSINQVAVSFALSGRPFKIGIWEQSAFGQYPGKLLYISDSLISTAGNYILDFKKPVSVSGAFFVGLRQLTTTNIAFGYQDEDPIRPSTFFYAAPAGDTNWFDFAPDAPYRFLLEPRMQGDTDLTVLSADYPKDSLDKYVLDTLAPRATIGNIGAKDLKDSFQITCEINFYGKIVYKEVLKDTLSAGLKRSYTFPKTFFPKDFGEHELLIYTSHPQDQIIDNDTARRKFYVGVKNDAMVATVFEPSNNTQFEYALDTFTPVATIQNPSFNNSKSITARCVIYKGTKVVYNQSQTLTLPKFNSKILAWPTYVCLDTGKLLVQFTTTMAGDAFRANDTINRTVWVFKSYDLGIDSVLLPSTKVFYTPGSNMKPLFRIYNDGILDATDVLVACRISSPYTATVYRDTIKVNVDAKTQYLAQFAKLFKPLNKGLYTLTLKSFFAQDRVPNNDSFAIQFHVGYPYDYQSISVLYPKATDTFPVGTGALAPKLRIKNNGYTKVGDICPVVFQIWKGKQKLYQDIKSLSLDTGLTFDLDFAKSFTPLFAGNHTIIAYTNYASDVHKSNDTVMGAFYVTVGRDAYVVSIDTPSASPAYEARIDNIPIKAQITNAGKLSMKSLRISAEIYYQGVRKHFDALDDSLDAGEVKLLTFPLGFVPQQAGMYRLIVYTYSQQDQNITNDTAELFFNVLKRYDVEASSWKEPTVGSIIIHNSGNRIPGITISQIGSDTAAQGNGTIDFYIFNLSGTEVFRDSGDFAGLTNQNTMDVYAGNSWTFDIPGFYTAKAVIRPTDRFQENDTLYSAFEVRLNSLQQINANTLGVYPNPGNNVIHIRGTKPLLRVTAINALGQNTLLEDLNNGQTYDVSALSPGLYFLVAEGQNSRYILRFIKE